MLIRMLKYTKRELKNGMISVYLGKNLVWEMSYYYLTQDLGSSLVN